MFRRTVEVSSTGVPSDDSASSLKDQTNDAELLQRASKLILRRIMWVMRWLTRASLLGYLLFLSVLAFAFWRVGEQNITLAFLLYLPTLGWFLPLLPLGFMALIFDRWSWLWAPPWVAILYIFLMDISWHESQPVMTEKETFTIMTFNRGQRGKSTQRPFMAKHEPDVVLYQEGAIHTRAILQAEGYEWFKYADRLGEFSLISRYPILSKSLVRSDPNAAPVAARFTIDWEGQEIALYSVHLVTPRFALQSMSRGGFLWGILGFPGTKGAENRQHYSKFWQQQIEDLKTVIAEVQKDTLPTIIAGDFNASGIGYMNRLLVQNFADLHREVGKSSGYTFPGKTRNPLSRGGPWLRLDKVIYDPKKWEPLFIEVEPEQPSQHRAVMAGLKLKADL